MLARKLDKLHIAMLSIHSSPLGELGTQVTGGMSVYVRELASEIGRRGHHIDIFTRRLDPQIEPIIVLEPNVRLIHLGIGNNGHIAKSQLHHYLNDFFKSLDKFKTDYNTPYDIIHSHYWLSGQMGTMARERWQVPHVLMYHTLGMVKNHNCAEENEPALRIAAEKQLAQDCHRILASTVKEKELLVRHCDIAADKVGVVPCGVNLQRFQPVDRATARQKLGFEANESIILYVGRFAPLKGIERLLNAVQKLEQRRLVRLVLIGGDGPHSDSYQTLQNKATALNIQAHVTFAGRIDQKELPPYYSAADVLVLPSHYESFGLVALEALACGTPVVATPVGAMEQIVHNGETGQIISDPSPESLASSIDTFLSKANSSHMAPDVLRSSVLRYSWSHAAAAMIQEYALVFQTTD